MRVDIVTNCDINTFNLNLRKVAKDFESEFIESELTKLIHILWKCYKLSYRIAIYSFSKRCTSN